MNSVEEPLNWARLHSEVEGIQGITQKQKERIAFGWHSLEKTLGPSWLEDAITDNHPWIASFRNKAPWIKSYYGLIGERISDLYGTPGFSIIIEKLKTTQDPVGVIGEINAGWKLFKNGINFQYIEAKRKEKSADIRTTIDNKEISIEVTVFRFPEFQLKQIRSLEEISKALTHPLVSTGAKIHRPLSLAHAKEIAEEINRSISTSLKMNRKIERRLQDDVEFCIAPLKLQNQVISWKKERNMKPETTLFSPDFYDGSGRKVSQTIRRKMKQIGSELPGVIYIEGFSFTVTSYGIGGSQYFKIGEIEEEVYEYDNLLFLVLNNLHRLEREILPLARKATWQPYFYIGRKNIAPYLSEQTWLITNRFHKWPKLRHKKLVRSFWYRGRGDPMKTWEERVMKDMAEQFAGQDTKRDSKK